MLLVPSGSGQGVLGWGGVGVRVESGTGFPVGVGVRHWGESWAWQWGGVMQPTTMGLFSIDRSYYVVF